MTTCLTNENILKSANTFRDNKCLLFLPSIIIPNKICNSSCYITMYL